MTRSRGARFSVTEPAHGHAKQNGENRNLQNLVVGHRLRDVLGKGVQQDFIPAHWSLRLGNGGMLRNSQPNTCVRNVDGRQANQHRDGSEDFEIDQRLEPHPSQAAHLPVGGDTGNQSSEN